MITVDEVDRAIADRVRAARIDAGITLRQLADLIGVTLQQAHRYEAGINRISGGRLYMIARALGCSVASLFPGNEPEPPVEAQKHPHAAREIVNLMRPGMSNDRLEALLIVARALADTRPL
jgi:transcriptional regulator with XRE-family HTH domain